MPDSRPAYPLRVVAAKTHFGAGEVEVDALRRALDLKPVAVGMQGATGDFGPYYLGANASDPGPARLKADLEILLAECLPRNIPLVLGGAPSGGTATNVQAVLDILQEVVAEQQLSFKLAVIYGDIPRELVLERLKDEEMPHLERAGQNLTPADIEATTSLVAYMGWRPIVEALEGGADVVITGRVCDDAIQAAPLIWKGVDPALAWHVGKLIECGSMCADTPDMDSPALATIYEDHFIVEPMSDRLTCTVKSIIAHNLYERGSGTVQSGPYGDLKFSEVRLEQVSPRAVKVSGSVFEPRPNTLLLEGAGPAGFRAITVAGVRDAEVIARIDELQKFALSKVEQAIGADGYSVKFHTYGVNGTLGEYESELTDPAPKEIGLVTDVLATTQALAADVCQRLYNEGHMFMWPGRVRGEGNFASPFSPLVLETGHVYRYTANHLMSMTEEQERELFPILWSFISGDEPDSSSDQQLATFKDGSL